MVILEEPYSEEKISSLKINDNIEITGTIFTMRDLACKYLFDGNKIPANLSNAIIYHSGPIVIKEKNRWKIISAGPTTSSRQEPYLWKLIEKYDLKGIMGKGGMGEKTTESCKKTNCCYMSVTGGAASLLANKILSVKNVYLMDKFGSAEAIWKFEVKNFPAIVTIDSHGNNLHKLIKDKSEQILKSSKL